MDRVPWVDAGVTRLGVDVGTLVEFVAAPTGYTVNVRLCKWGLSGDDKLESTVVVHLRQDWATVVFASRCTKAVVRVRRDWTANIQLCKWSSSGGDNPESGVVRIRQDRATVVLARRCAKSAVRVRRD